MDAVMRKAVEERAYALWDEAGRPEGSALMYWLRAEQEFGIIPKVEPDVPLVTLQEIAAEARALEESEATPADEPLQESVDKAVPTAERLPGGADENPISEHVESIAQGQAPRRYRAPRQSRVGTRYLAGTKGASCSSPRGVELLA